MANPQPDQFTKISNELYSAIMQTNFSKRQRNIIDLIIRMSYGCRKKSALFRLGDFELVGIHKSDIRNELKTLQRFKVIFIQIVDELIRVSLNKDYDQWLLQPACDDQKWERLLNRNLEDEVGILPTDSESEVGKIPTDLETEVGKTPTHSNKVVGNLPTGVGEIPTNLNDEVGNLPTVPENEVGKTPTGESENENGSWQNTNKTVGKIPTTTPVKLNSDNGSQPPKDSKDSSFSLIPDRKERKKGVRGKKPEDLRSVEEVVEQFTRYPPDQRAVILRYWDSIKDTRATGKIANSVIESNMNYWEKFELDIVIESLEVHMMRHLGKKEDYTCGIMRGRADERKRKVVSIHDGNARGRSNTPAGEHQATEYPAGGIG